MQPVRRKAESVKARIKVVEEGRCWPFVRVVMVVAKRRRRERGGRTKAKLCWRCSTFTKMLPSRGSRQNSTAV